MAPRWPNLSLKVRAPNAWPRSWWPRQIPKIGMPRDSAAVRISVRSVAVASASGRGIARPVREEDPVGLVVEDRLGRGRAGHDRDLAADIDQVAGDVPLHAEVERDDVRATAVAGSGVRAGSIRVARPALDAKRRVQAELPGRRPLGHDLAGQVAADQAGAGLGLGHQAGVVEVGRREDALHRPALAGQADQGAGVDPLDADDAVSLEIVGERAARAVSC